jgi:F-type H+-transporting ATPase subunit b
VKLRGQRWCWSIVLLATIVALLTAGSAGASEGELVLLPDWTGKLPLLMLLFAALMFPANALLFKPIFRVLDEREQRIGGTRQRAERIRAEAEETLANYEHAVRDVREEAERDRKQRASEAREQNIAVTSQARSEAEAQLERARGELAASLDASRRALRSQAEELAHDAASRILGRSL